MLSFAFSPGAAIVTVVEPTESRRAQPMPVA
jgi:hypothetical protein